MALIAEEVTVAYPGNKALDGVTLEISPGRVHVLVGQNGAGKSTLIKVLSGSVVPNEGRVVVDEDVVSFRRPADAARAGIRVVPQELQLFSHLPVWENVTVGVPASRFGTVSRGALRLRAERTLRQLGEDVDVDKAAGELTPAQQQRVTIARTMVQRTRFLIFDEPTAALSREERGRLLDVIRTIAGEGVGVLFVSHHLEESLAIGDDVTVLRDARRVWTRQRADVDEATLTTAMFGRGVAAASSAQRGARPSSSGRVLLSTQNLRWVGARFPLDLEVPVGRVTGIAGLPGSGADTLNSALIGETPRRGKVAIEGRPLPGGIAAALRRGMGYIPSDRKATGLFVRMSVTDNLCAPNLARYQHLGVLSGGRMRTGARQMIDDLSASPAAPETIVANLSGGTQQKVLVGRWLAAGVKLLLANEPTRGVDIATRVQIHQFMRSFAAEGGACLIYSSDLLELVDACDDLVVLRRDGPPFRIEADLSPDALYEAMSSTSRSRERV